MRTPSISKKSKVYGLKSIVSSPHSAFRNPRSHGFTLLELLIVISLIMVLAGLMIPAFYKVRNRVRDQKRTIELRVISSAIAAYKTQEKKLPAPDPDLRDGKDLWYGADGDGTPLAGGNNSEVMNILKAAVPPVFDPNKLRWDAYDNAIDPYDKQYKIELKLSYSEFGAGYKVE